MIRLLLGLALALSLTACASPGVNLSVDQGLAVAEAGADGINHMAIVAAPSLHGANALKAKAAIDTVNHAVDAAHTAKTQGLAGTPAAVTAALAAIADARAALANPAPVSK